VTFLCTNETQRYLTFSYGSIIVVTITHAGAGPSFEVMSDTCNGICGYYAVPLTTDLSNYLLIIILVIL